jgi:hypothetical protein
MASHVVHTIKDRFEEVYLFSTTSKYDQEGYNYVPKKNRFNGFDETAMEKIFNDQDMRVEEKMKNLKW